MCKGDATLSSIVTWIRKQLWWVYHLQFGLVVSKLSLLASWDWMLSCKKMKVCWICTPRLWHLQSAPKSMYGSPQNWQVVWWTVQSPLLHLHCPTFYGHAADILSWCKRATLSLFWSTCPLNIHSKVYQRCWNDLHCQLTHSCGTSLSATASAHHQPVWCPNQCPPRKKEHIVA